MCDAGRRRLSGWLRRMRAGGSRQDPVAALPEEVMHLVWALLGLGDLLAASLVSRAWYRALRADTAWRRFCRDRSGPAGAWKGRFLDERSLVHNWAHNNYYTSIRSPLSGQVAAGERRLCVWSEESVKLLDGECLTRGEVRAERVVEVQWSGRSLLVVREEGGGRRGRVYGDTGEERADLGSVGSVLLEGETVVEVGGAEVALRGLDGGVRKVPLPECKEVGSVRPLGRDLLVRLEPLDYSYEAVYYLYRYSSDEWSLLNKNPRSALGARVYLEFASPETFVLVNHLLLEDTFMYSNVQLYSGHRLVARDVISDSKRPYFRAAFTDSLALYSVADYRLTALHLPSLKRTEVYLPTGFLSIHTVLHRFFVVAYPDGLHVWDCTSLKKLHSVPLLDRDCAHVRDDFIAVTSWPCHSLPRSLRVLSFREPSFPNKLTL